MTILFGIILIIHFIGLASLLGGTLIQAKENIAGKGRIVTAMVHGALTQLVSGILLVSLIEVTGGYVDTAKIATKLSIVIVITVLVFMFRKKQPLASWVVWAIGALTLTNIAIAVLWR